ncbi:probable carotenoid cleavage dioxygenase 4 chloroplastic [Phtheirospermum japonicum]|uniref:Probable carotenoid cleavage dioxygenase 4 chloroplastic n=1 Tax=Phtheirospermum japonicum TaxID=374723 RepID=A0A830D3I2_9LAMI|nr:probable carotenoid cleavage dioxygenase 4 chloroplastic [Phtheirospermum japonicum]
MGSRILRRGCTGNETFFVPKEPENPSADEDDGFLVTYVHDVGTRESRFVVMDAKSTTLETVAAVKLPARVPCCFHGLFLSDTQLKKL